MNKKIVYVTSTLTQGLCGVADYTMKLAEVINNKSKFNAIVMLPSSCLRMLLNSKELPAVVHVQLPGVNFGIFPLNLYFFLVAIKALWRQINIVITFHEPIGEIKSILKHIPFLLVANHIIYVDDAFKKTKFWKLVKWSKLKVEKINIFSSIPAWSVNLEKNINMPNSDYICFFGLIKQGKGVEKIIDIVRKSNYISYIIGPFSPDKNPYHSGLQEILKNIGLKGRLIFTDKLPANDVAFLLYHSKANLFLFDKGVTERNSSVLASLAQSNVTFVTCRPDVESSIISNNIHFLDLNVATDECIAAIRLSKRANGVSPFDREVIAKQHSDMYAKF